jgi:uncharacterized protein (TIGR03083 family)
VTAVDSSVTVEEGWDASQYANKDHLLRVVHGAWHEFYDLVRDPDNWEVQVTFEWQVRDLAGHLVDVIEGYLAAFGYAREGKEAPAPFGLRIMKDRLAEQALALRSVPREELLNRLHDDFHELMRVLKAADEREWTNLMVCHPYMGPVPPFCYPAFQLMDYGVHSWDIRTALGRFTGLNADVADFLVPFMFILMQGTHDAEHFPDLPAPIGFRISGRNAGTWKVTITNGAFTFEPAPVDDLPAVFEFDPASFVLTTYARIHGGTNYGDRALGDSFRGMFFAI